MVSLKILFVIRSGEHLLYFRSIVEELLKRGHKVKLLYDAKWTDEKDPKILADFKNANKNYDFEYGVAVRRNDAWRKILFHTREILSYRSYLLEPRRNLRKYYHDRWLGYLPATLQSVLRYGFVRSLLGSSVAAATLRFFERIAPPDKKICEDIVRFRPDVVVASPVNMRFSSADLEYLKAAKQMSIPTALPVISWDNLTNKGLIHVMPDILLAWNRDQAAEARIPHGVPMDKIKLIGAPVFDQWFSSLKLGYSRKEFCDKYGLRESDPILAYLGSSVNVAQDESWLVADLRKALNEADEIGSLPAGSLRNTQIIIRPHPANYKIYDKLNLKKVIILPKTGTLPDSKDSAQIFYDTLYHAAAVLGVNTSGMIDAIIVGKPVMSILPKMYKDSQSETQHFQYLLENDVLEITRNLDEFLEIFKKILTGRDAKKEQREAFIKKYIRPNGLEKSAGDAAADEIEKITRY